MSGGQGAARPRPLALVVEDSERNRRLARDVLAFHGFDVVEAATGEQGVALAIERLPDVVLMDIQMPGIDGITALGRIREAPAAGRIPVVAVTASVLPEDRERFARAGFDGLIPKPIEVSRFADQVRAAVARGRA